jgi:hypothetical protein
MEKGRGTTLSILKFEISINVVRLVGPKAMHMRRL